VTQPVPQVGARVRFYRVYSHLDGAAAYAPGHALFVPSPATGRTNNEELYTSLYVSTTAHGAVAEVFGDRTLWDRGMLRGTRRITGSWRALATLELPASAARLCDLDSVAALAELGVARPSRVVARDYDVTAALAARIYRAGAFDGIAWWSFHHPDLVSAVLWNRDAVRLVDTRPLDLDDAALAAAADLLNRRTA
jgi:hypothetical protein